MTDMTDDQKDALAWLEGIAAAAAPWGPSAARHARALKLMLAEPRLPAEPTDEALSAMLRTYNGAPDFQGWDRKWVAVFRALYAHLTKPKTVEVWRVEYATKWTEDDGTVWRPAGQTFPEREDADREAVRLSGNPHYNRCIRVTGPHKQEIPA